MKNRPVWSCFPGSARVSRGNASSARAFGVAPKQSFLNPRISRRSVTEEKFATARRGRQQARPVRYPVLFAAFLVFVPFVCFGQQASPTPTPSPSEMEAEPVVVTATRFDIPLDL